MCVKDKQSHNTGEKRQCHLLGKGQKETFRLLQWASSRSSVLCVCLHKSDQIILIKYRLASESVKFVFGCIAQAN